MRYRAAAQKYDSSRVSYVHADLLIDYWLQVIFVKLLGMLAISP